MYSDFDSDTWLVLAKIEHRERVQWAAQKSLQQALWRQYRAQQPRRHRWLLRIIRQGLLTFSLWVGALQHRYVRVARRVVNREFSPVSRTRRGAKACRAVE
jgi:hypothetical protein